MKEDTVVMQGLGIRKSRWDLYIQNYIILTDSDLNPEVTEKTKAWLSWAHFTPDNQMINIDNLYDITKKGDIASLVADSNQDLIAGKINIVTALSKLLFTAYYIQISCWYIHTYYVLYIYLLIVWECQSKGTFKLSPDKYVYEESMSIAGGIFKEVKKKRKYKPRNLSDDDVKALTSFATLNAIN